MKKIIMLVAVLMTASIADAQYFKMIDPRHPQTSVGIYSDLTGKSDPGVSLALVTHSTKDGCIIKGVCLDWTPLSVGSSLGNNLGGRSISIGSSANLLPAVEQGLLTIVNTVFPGDSSLTVLKKMLKPSISGNPDVAIAVGPQWSYVFLNNLHGKGVVTLFTGAAWKF